MIFELVGDRLHFQTISDLGKTIDSGVITRRRVDTKAEPSQPVAPSAKPVPPQDKPATSTAKPTTSSTRPAAPAGTPAARP
jgi:hypothetical protein